MLALDRIRHPERYEEAPPPPKRRTFRAGDPAPLTVEQLEAMPQVKFASPEARSFWFPEANT